MDPDIVNQLKEYFSKRDDICLALIFGSQVSGRQKPSSDWDIGIYFNPNNGLELETSKEYPGEQEIYRAVDNIVKAETDVVVLNRARPSLVFTVLNSGVPLIIKNNKLYLELLSKTHYEAVDFWNFIREFWQMREKAASLIPEAKAILIEHLTFLENELADLAKFQNFSRKDYFADSDKRRNMERWLENIVMSSLDIAKVILASEKKDVPQTYRETLRIFGILYFDASFADKFSEFADLRNIVAHKYLDVRWERIQKFIKEAKELYPIFVQKIKEIVF